MKTYLISYDINSPRKAEVYQKLGDYTRAYGTWAKPLESLWLIKTDRDITIVRDQLLNLCDQNDQILVIDVTDKTWATFGIDKEVINWMQNNL